MSEQRDPRDPPRWLDDTELANDLRGELSAVVADGPGLEQRARMFASLERELGLSVGAQSGVQLAARSAAQTATTATKLKLVLASVAVLAGAVGLFALWSARSVVPPAGPLSASSQAAASHELAPNAPLPVEELPMPRAHEEQAPRRADELAALPTPPPHRSGPRRARRDVARAVARVTAAALPAAPVSSRAALSFDELEDARVRDRRADPVAELALLAQARRALLTQPAHALEFTEVHARDYPQGTFGEEREVLAIESLFRLGLTDEAKQRAAAFEQRFPNSTQRAHLARMIQTLSP
ncbi:MAG: hypothetical protein JWN48_2226 [Myxococcaceae bacterium]|nr:hypothetical protein [Myxococcaceae bacterium]